MASQLALHDSRFEIQDLVGAPLCCHRSQRAAVRAAREPGPAQARQLPRRTETQTLPRRNVPQDWPALETGGTTGQEIPGRAVRWPGTVVPSTTLEEAKGGPCGQRGKFPVAAQVPHAGAFA